MLFRVFLAPNRIPISAELSKQFRLSPFYPNHVHGRQNSSHRFAMAFPRFDSSSTADDGQASYLATALAAKSFLLDDAYSRRSLPPWA